MAVLQYDLTAVGLSSIDKAFRSIEGYAIAHNRKMQSLFGSHGGPSNDTGRAVGSRAGGALSVEKQLAKETAVYEKESQRWRKIQQRAADYRIKEALRAEKEITRETERESKKRERLIEQENKSIVRARKAIGGGMLRGLDRVGGWLGSAGAIGSGLLGLGGGVMVANALHGGMKIDAAASGLANQMVDADSSREALTKQKSAVLAKAKRVRGASTLDAIGSARAFGGISGNYGLGLDMAQDFTNIALATDVDLGDVSRLAGNAYMKIKTPGMSDEEARKQTLEAVRTFAGQGNIGAVEIKDLAEYGGRLTAGAAQFKGSRVENMAKMGTLAQVAVGSGSATDAAEATMAATRFASDLIEHSKDVEKLKVGGKNINPFVKDAKGNKIGFQSLDTLVADIMQGTGGDMEKMKGIFGERSYKMAQGFQQIYLDAEKGQKGSGREAVMAKFEEFSKAAVSEKDVETRAASRLADTDMQLEMAMKDLNEAIDHNLKPAFLELLPAVKDLVPVFADSLSTVKDFMGRLSDAEGFLAKLFPKSHVEAVEKQHRKEMEGTGSAHERTVLAKKHLSQLKEEQSSWSSIFFDSADSRSARESAITSAQADVEGAERQERYAAKQDKLTDAVVGLTSAINTTVKTGGLKPPPRGANGTTDQVPPNDGI